MRIDITLQFSLVVRCRNLTMLAPTMMWGPGGSLLWAPITSCALETTTSPTAVRKEKLSLWIRLYPLTVLDGMVAKYM